jgi:hypothetical protein
MVVGPPGAMKSPAIEEVLKPIRRIEAKAAIAYEGAKAHYDREMQIFGLMEEDAKK